MRGGHSALTADYTCLAEDLASHGYFVVGFDAPYRTFVTVLSNGKVIARSTQNNAELVGGAEQQRVAERLVQDWSPDMSFALDQLQQLNASDPSGRFRGRLNLDRVGAFGHSLGGAEALQFCHDDARCKAGVDVDGAPFGSVVADGVKQPFMFLLSDHGREPAAESGPVMANIHSIYDRLPSDGRLQVVVRGANHYNFSDNGLLRAPLLMRVLRGLGIGRLEGRRQILVSAHYITTFFDVYLRGAPPSRLQNRPDFPEAQARN
jgi:predicted dienelactone hydrolase